MNRLSLVLALLVASLSVSAQQRSSVQHSVYVAAGLSIAPEDLAGIKGIDNKGYVEDGSTVAVSYLAEVRRYVGVGATIGYSRNNLNADAIAGAASSEIKTEAYAHSFLTADIYGIYPVKQWRLYGRVGLGMVLPGAWQMQVTNSMGSGTVQSRRKLVPGYSAGIGFTYALSKFNVGLDSGLLASKPEFEARSASASTSKKQWVSVFNHTIRAGYRF
ncbi:MAG TPA: outer membrane beta-barrel protein [Pontibacter sp.]